MTRRNQGFTLLEIMFALVAGLIAISVVYSLNNGTTRVLTEQNRVASTQTALRLAMEQIRADIERAGFLTSPNGAVEDSCGTPPFTVQAVQFQSGEYTTNVPNAAAHGVRADGLELMGNYVTSGQYLIRTLAADDGSALDLQTTWQSFRRDFTVQSGTSVVIDETWLARAFPVGRMLQVETLEGHHIFTRVTSAVAGTDGDGPTARIGVGPAITPGGLCVVGLAGSATVSPISRIEYAIENPVGNTALSALVRLRSGGSPAETDTSRAAIEGIPSVLVRRELDSTGAIIANTTRVVLEFAVEFSLTFDLDTNSGPDKAPILSTNQPNYGTSPQQVRAIRVTLSARTPDAEPNHAWIARASGAPLTRYYARDAAPAAGLPSSRVRTLTSTIFVPNVAYADLP